MSDVPAVLEIVPAGELDGAKDYALTRIRSMLIVPAGELDGAKDF